MSRMSPVATLIRLQKEIEIERAQWKEALIRAAKENFKLRQEVTGGMQVIYYMASQCPDRTLTIKAVDLIATMGSLQRKYDVENDVYSFIAIEPTPEEVADAQAATEAALAEAVDTPTVGLTDQPTEDVAPVEIGDATA